MSGRRRIGWAIACGVPAWFAGTASVVNADVWYVDHTANGSNTGRSWADAFTDLQDALVVARSHDRIWVAAGTYKPDRGTGDLAGDDGPGSRSE